MRVYRVDNERLKKHIREVWWVGSVLWFVSTCLLMVGTITPAVDDDPNPFIPVIGLTLTLLLGPVLLVWSRRTRTKLLSENLDAEFILNEDSCEIRRPNHPPWKTITFPISSIKGVSSQYNYMLNMNFEQVYPWAAAAIPGLDKPGIEIIGLAGAGKLSRVLARRCGMTVKRHRARPSSEVRMRFSWYVLFEYTVIVALDYSSETSLATSI